MGAEFCKNLFLLTLAPFFICKKQQLFLSCTAKNSIINLIKNRYET